LLVAERMGAQRRPPVGHDGLARLQQQARQVAMGEDSDVRIHLFNMLNEVPFSAKRRNRCLEDL